VHLYSWIKCVDFLYFLSNKTRVRPTGVVSFFPLPDAGSPPVDIVTLSHRVTLPSHWCKMSSPSPLHLSAMICLVAAPLELKPKHWIHSTIAGYPSWTTLLPPFTVIKRYLNIDHYPHHSITSLFCLLSNQSTISLKLHLLPLFPFIVVSCLLSIRITTPTVTN
jgi:hypothetical protein